VIHHINNNIIEAQQARDTGISITIDSSVAPKKQKKISEKKI
jgi:hypothetical protein